MRVFFVSPHFNSFAISPPLGLGYLASALRQKGHEVKIVDCLAKNMSNRQLIRLIAHEAPDLVGFSVYTFLSPKIIDIIDKIKNICSTRIVIGGHHITASPAIFFSQSQADFAVFGEGEQTITELCDAIDGADYHGVKGICFKDDKGNVVQTEPRQLIYDLDKIAWPAWDLINPSLYSPAPHGFFYKQYPQASIITSRGCPFHCTFCAQSLTWGHTLRTRSANNVVDEITYLREKYQVQEFQFEDDNLTLCKSHAMDICEKILKKNINILWSCPDGVRIDTLDLELLQTMRKSGCYKLGVGIESASQAVLDAVRKKMNIDQIVEKLYLIKKVGMQLEGFFLLGLPGETKEDCKMTIDFALRHPFDIARFNIAIPFPGTEIYKGWRKDLIADPSWSEFVQFGKPLYETKYLSTNDILKMRRKAYRRFYLRWKTLKSLLAQLKLRQVGYFLFRALKLFS